MTQRLLTLRSLGGTELEGASRTLGMAELDLYDFGLILWVYAADIVAGVDLSAVQTLASTGEIGSGLDSFNILSVDISVYQTTTSTEISVLKGQSSALDGGQAITTSVWRLISAVFPVNGTESVNAVYTSIAAAEGGQFISLADIQSFLLRTDSGAVVDVWNALQGFLTSLEDGAIGSENIVYAYLHKVVADTGASAETALYNYKTALEEYLGIEINYIDASVLASGTAQGRDLLKHIFVSYLDAPWGQYVFYVKGRPIKQIKAPRVW